MLEKLIRNKTIYAIASIVIGIFMIIKRGNMAYDVIRIIGWLLVGMGAAYAVSYFIGEDKDQVKIGYAILAVIGGLLVVWMAPTIVHIFPVLAGVLLIINGITNYTGVNREDPDAPAYSKGTAIAVIVLGILVIVFSRMIINAVVLIMGICLVLNGLAELNIIRRFW